VRGNATPRLWTPPLRPLTPETSIGYDQVDFARHDLGRPFDPWQEFVVIHAGELLPDGRPRFRLVLVIVARQNGKTEIPVILSIYWLWVDEWPLVLGTSTKLDYAQESWEKAIAAAKRRKHLWRDIPRRGGVRRANGEQVLKRPVAGRSYDACRYKIAASNEEGGRSLTIDRLVLDELRQHQSYAAWDASYPALSARPYGQAWALSNAGDDRSVVLNDKRQSALDFIAWWDEHGDERVGELLAAGHRFPGMPDPRIGIFEYSAPDDADPRDPVALAQANPNLGHPEHGARLDELLGEAATAIAAGGKALAGFKTERMCIRVHTTDAAVDATAWARNAAAVDLAGLRVALCVDVSPDLQHATLTAAAQTGRDRTVLIPDPDSPGAVRELQVPIVAVDVVEAWEGPTAVRQMTAAIPALVAKIRPAVFGWLPGGPAVAAVGQLRDRNVKGRVFKWPPRGVRVEEITSEVTGVCMSFAADVKADLVEHGDDPLQNAHVLGADKLPVGGGEVWRFMRVNRDRDAPQAPHVDAAYAAAGAVHLARTLPTGIGFGQIITGYDSDTAD
jgi:hypothetical protein